MHYNHGTINAYNIDACRCGPCKLKMKEHNARRKTGNTPHRVTRVSEETFMRAYDMLVDGVPYREVSRTFDIPRTTLRERFPGMGSTSSEGGKLGHFIMSSQTVHDLQREIGLLQNGIH